MPGVFDSDGRLVGEGMQKILLLFVSFRRNDLAPLRTRQEHDPSAVATQAHFQCGS